MTEAALDTGRSHLRSFWGSDVIYDFRHDPVAVFSASLLAVLVLSALFANWIAPQNPFDLKQLDILNSLLPPSWAEGGEPKFLLGTDDQGRDMLSAILFGMRISLLVGFLSVGLSILLGVFLGLVAGLAGGWFDNFLMRVADIQLSFPAILIAMLIDGAARAALPPQLHDQVAIPILVVAISLSGWVQYARTVRGATMVEKTKEYVLAAEVIGVPKRRIMLKHILPNVSGPVFVLATVHIATAILTEATLSFLGVGVPPTAPSLGSLIRIGNDYLFSGDWWITIFPGMALICLVLSANLLGDWMRDALNPRLQ